MVNISNLHRLAGIFLLFFVLADSLFAALPPLDEKRLKEMADLIVTGTVVNIRKEDITSGDFVKTYHHVEVAIKEIEKGKIDSKSVIAKGWIMKKTPSGWAGPSGIYDLDEVMLKSEVRLFLESNFEIVEPNGLQILKAKK